jgi:hypothetical protein
MIEKIIFFEASFFHEHRLFARFWASENTSVLAAAEVFFAFFLFTDNVSQSGTLEPRKKGPWTLF